MTFYNFKIMTRKIFRLKCMNIIAWHVRFSLKQNLAN